MKTKILAFCAALALCGSAEAKEPPKPLLPSPTLNVSESKKLADCIWTDHCGIHVMFEPLPGGVVIRAIGIRAENGVEFHYFMTLERNFGIFVKEPNAGVLLIDKDGDGTVDLAAFVEGNTFLSFDPKKNAIFQKIYGESLGVARKMGLDHPAKPKEKL